MARKVRGDLNIEYLAGDGGKATTLNKAALLIDSPKGEWISGNQRCRSRRVRQTKVSVEKV